MTDGIPDKLFFRIGEVAELAGVKPHVLRYWESEVKSIKPTKSKTNQRLYRRKDVELVLRLKELLYNQGYTLAGAKKALRDPAQMEEQVDETVPAQQEDHAPYDGQFMLPLNCDIDRHLLKEIERDLRLMREKLCGDLPD